MSTTIGTQAGGSGLGSSRRVIYAINSALYWAFAYTGTNVLSTWHSPDNATWTAGATHTLSNAHLSEGRNLAVGYKSIGGVDVVHVGWAFKTGASLGYSTIRATIASTTLTFHSSETALNTGTSDLDTLYWSGGSIEIDSNNKVHIGNGWVNSSSDGGMAAERSAADPGTAEQMTPLAETDLLIDVSEPTETRSCYLVDLGSGTMGMMADDGSAITTTTGLEWATWSGSGAWAPIPGITNVTVTGTTSAMDRNDWGCVGASPTDVHVVYRSGTNTYVHRRYNGTSWSNGQTIPTQNSLAGGGIALCSDGRSVWLSVIDTDGANTVRTIRWTAAAFNGLADAWDATWTATESSSQTRTWIGACKDVQAQTGLVYWTQGSSLVAATFSAVTPDPLWFQTAQTSSSASGTTLGVAFTTANLTAGNRIIVAATIWGAGAPTITSVTDSAGNTYAKDSPANVFSDGTDQSVWSAPITAGAGTKPTVTIHASGTTTEWSMFVHEYAVSAATSNYLDGTHVFNTSTGTSPITSGASSPTPGATGELAFGYYGDDAVNASITPSGGWAQRGTSIVGSGAITEGACADNTTTAGVGSNASFVIATNGQQAGCIVVVYKLPGSTFSFPEAAHARLPRSRPLWLRRERAYQSGQRQAYPAVAATSALGIAGEADAISTVAATASAAVALAGTASALSATTAAATLATSAAGSSAAASADTATASITRSVAGTASALSSASAALGVSTAAAGSSSSVGALAATAAAAAALAGSSAAASAGNATLAVAQAAAGISAGSSLVSATLSVSATLTGATTAAATGTAAASLAESAAGTTTALSTATASATTAGAIALAGSSAAQTTASAALGASVAVIGSAAASGSASATLGASAALTAASVGIASGAGAATLALAASGASTGQATGSAALGASVVLSGTTAALSSATAGATTASGTAIAGSSAAASRASATLTVAVAASGSSTGAVSASATLGASATLAGTTGSASSASVTLGVGSAASGTSSASARSATVLTGTITVAGQSASPSGLAATPTVTATLAGASSDTFGATATVQASSGTPLAGISSGSSRLLATLTVSGALVATSTAALSTSAAILSAATLAGVSASTLLATATLASALGGPGAVTAYDAIAFRVGAADQVALLVAAYALVAFTVGWADQVAAPVAHSEGAASPVAAFDALV